MLTTNNQSQAEPFNRHIKAAEQRTIKAIMVIGTLAVDGWPATFGTARRGLGGLRPCPDQTILAEPNVTAHPCYSMWHCKYLCTLKG